MSTKAMGRLYTGNGGPSLGGGGGGGFANPSLLSSLFGQDAVTGGEGDSSYQGSGGIFGGQSRRLATMLQAQKNSQLTNIQADKDFIKLQAQLEQERMKSEATIKENQSIKDQVLKLSDRYNVHPDVLLDPNSPPNQSMTEGANLKQGLMNQSLRNPRAQDAANFGANSLLSGVNPNQDTLTPFGGVRSINTSTGDRVNLFGGTRQQQTEWRVDPTTGMMHPVTTEQDAPGHIQLPVNSMQYDQAKNLPAPQPNFTAGSTISGNNDINPNPGAGQDWEGGAMITPRTSGTSSTGVSSAPGISPTPADSQDMNGMPKGFYTAEEQNSPLAGFLRNSMGRIGQGFNPASLTGAGYSGIPAPSLPQQVSPNPGMNGGPGTSGYYQQLMQKLMQQQQAPLRTNAPPTVNGGVSAMPSTNGGVSAPMMGPQQTLGSPNRFGQYPDDMQLQQLIAGMLGGQQ